MVSIIAAVANVVVQATKIIMKRRQMKKIIAKKLRLRPTSSTDPTPRPYRRNYLSSQWWELIHNPLVANPTTSQGKLFRRRFRVPYPIFQDLLEKAEAIGFKKQPISIANVKGIPLELQLLGVLRVLGRGTCFDGVEELTGGSAEAHRSFFHKFCHLFVRKYYDEYVYLPRNNEEKARWMSDYARMGLPGAIGSTDCVHVKWERCPHGLLNVCTGKEGYATLAWQATVNHKMRFISVTRSFYGSSNDKTICKFDNLTQRMKSNIIYNEDVFELKDENGDTITEKGLYLICDGGFVKWRCMMTAYKYFSELKEALWSSQMESTRKDVERAFGILKGRFRCLKLPIFFQKQTDIDNMMWTCIILHNMILTHDGRDALWEEDIHWVGVDGEHDDDTEWPLLKKIEVITRRAMHKLTDYSCVGRRFYIDPSDEEAESSFYNLRKKLVIHYYYLYTYEKQQLEWLA